MVADTSRDDYDKDITESTTDLTRSPTDQLASRRENGNDITTALEADARSSSPSSVSLYSRVSSSANCTWSDIDLTSATNKHHDLPNANPTGSVATPSDDDTSSIDGFTRTHPSPRSRTRKVAFANGTKDYDGVDPTRSMVASIPSPKNVKAAVPRDTTASRTTAAPSTQRMSTLMKPTAASLARQVLTASKNRVTSTSSAKTMVSASKASTQPRLARSLQTSATAAKAVAPTKPTSRSPLAPLRQSAAKSMLAPASSKTSNRPPCPARTEVKPAPLTSPHHKTSNVDVPLWDLHGLSAVTRARLQACMA